jgi:hypothetical protein
MVSKRKKAVALSSLSRREKKESLLKGKMILTIYIHKACCVSLPTAD